MEFIFPEGFDSYITTYDKKIVCKSPNLTQVDCYVENGKLIVPFN